MANMKEILPKGEYKVSSVGPSENWEFTGNNGTVEMAKDVVQFEGHEAYWVEVNRARKSDALKVGDTLKGHIEQDENEKYKPKFVKEKGAGGGNWGGGGNAKASPGAIWAQNVATASQIVGDFYRAAGKKPKDFDSYLGKVKAVAPMVGKMVDGFVAANPESKPAAPATNSEAGESPAPAAAPAAAPQPSPGATENVKIEDISDEDLGEW